MFENASLFVVDVIDKVLVEELWQLAGKFKEDLKLIFHRLSRWMYCEQSHYCKLVDGCLYPLHSINV